MTLLQVNLTFSTKHRTAKREHWRSYLKSSIAQPVSKKQICLKK